LYRIKFKLFITLLFIFLSGFLRYCITDDWKYKVVSQDMVNAFNKHLYLTNKNDFYDLTLSLPIGFVKDGSVDYTSYIQDALDVNRKVIFPNFKLLINKKGLVVKSNSVIYFSDKSKLVLMPNNLKEYQIIKLHDVKNVILYNIKIVGDRYNHTGLAGEWGMGISILGSQNINIINPQVIECWGDGIYLGKSKKSYNNINVSIKNAYLDDNRRNGMSIICAENLKVENILVSNTHGTSPMAGIDIEPDENKDVLQNIKFKNIVAYNNATHGFLFALSFLGGDLSHENVTIDISNIKIYYSAYGMSFKLQQDSKIENVTKGRITISNPVFYDVKKSNFLSYPGNSENPFVVKIKIPSASKMDILKANYQFKTNKNFTIKK